MEPVPVECHLIQDHILYSKQLNPANFNYIHFIYTFQPIFDLLQIRNFGLTSITTENKTLLVYCLVIDEDVAQLLVFLMN